MSPKHSSQNRKTDKYNHIIAKSLDSKGNTQQSEERTCEMAKNICKPHVFYYGLITTAKKKKKKKKEAFNSKKADNLILKSRK